VAHCSLSPPPCVRGSDEVSPSLTLRALSLPLNRWEGGNMNHAKSAKKEMPEPARSWLSWRSLRLRGARQDLNLANAMNPWHGGARRLPIARPSGSYRKKR